MSTIAAQWIGAIIVGVALFYVFADPKGTSDILNAFGNLNTGAIAALQGRGVTQTAGAAKRRK